MVASLGVGEKSLLPLRDPLHWTAQPARRPHDDRLLRIVLSLVAEAAAHVLRHDAQGALVDGELLANIAADVVRRLGAAIQRVAVRNAAPRLNRRAAEPIVHQLDLHAMGGLCHRGLCSRAVAARPSERLLPLD